MIKLASIFETKAPAVDFYRNIGAWSYIDEVKLISAPRASDWRYILSMADALFIDRQFIGGAMQIATLAKGAGIPIIIDVDDDLFNIDIHHPSYDMLTSVQAQGTIKEVLKLADLLIVTTEALKKLYTQVNENIVVIPNAWNDYQHEMKDIGNRKARKKPFIAHRGARAHQYDIFQVHKTINKFLDKMDWYFFGEIPISVDANYNRTGWEPLHTFFASLTALSPDFLFVPLANTDFNKAKSNIAMIEASGLAGAVCIAPDWLPEFDTPGVLRYGVGEKNNLHKIFERALAMSKGEKEERVKAAQEHIKYSLRLSDWNAKRIDVLREFVKK